jgi:hypothetical protein
VPFCSEATIVVRVLISIASRISRFRFRRRTFCFRNLPNLALSPFLADMTPPLRTLRLDSDGGQPGSIPFRKAFVEQKHNLKDKRAWAHLLNHNK